MSCKLALQISALFFVVGIHAENFIGPNFPESVYNENYTFNWEKTNLVIKKAVDFVVNPNLKFLYKLAKNLSISKDCSSALFDLIKGLRNAKRWAMEMVDASGKIPSGILEGTVMDFGAFDECLKIRVNGSSGESFQGRYCMVGYRSPLLAPLSYKTPDGRSYLEAFGYPPEWISNVIEQAEGYLKRVAFWFGTCVPSTCSKEDITKISQVVSKPLGYEVSVSDCQVKEEFVWPTHIVVAVTVLSCLAAISAFGTTLDVILRFRSEKSDDVFKEREHWIVRTFKAFSVYSNTEKLLNTNGNGNDTLSFFNGIRFFSATWIILGHTYFFTDTWKYLKFRRLMGVTEQFNRNFPAAVMENFPIPVSSFFFMSGFLLLYTNWRKLEKNDGRLNLFMFFVHKYWRMTPALVVTIFLFLALPLIDSGPLWNSTLGPQIQTCTDRWWYNMLYISNWFDVDQFCLIHTWYLSALMQFHIVCVILLLLFFRWPIFGTLVGSTMVIGCFVITMLLTLAYDFPMPAPGMTKDMDVIDEYTSVIYIKPFSHVATYLVGMIVAYLLLKYRDCNIRWGCQVLLWVLSALLALASVYGIYGPDEPAILRALYIAGYRIAWACGLGWMTYACATGRGGIIRRILSWKAFAPLGQLSYLTYLVHPLVIIYRNASLRERVYYGHTELVYSFLAHTVVSFAVAFICHVTVETPFVILEGIIFRKSSTKLPDAKQKDFQEDQGNVCTKSLKSLHPSSNA